MDDEDRMHQEVWALLPWLANGSATSEQQRHARAHLQGCAACRAELAREGRLVDATRLPPGAVPEVERGLQRLMLRIDQTDDAPPVASRWRLLAGARLGIGAVALLSLGELLLVGALGWWWLQAPAPIDDAPYRTLTQRESVRIDGPRWRVVFQGRQTVGELRALLADQGLAIVAGPSEAGVFTLGPAVRTPGREAALLAPDADAVAARLRQAPGVVFAEAVGAGGAP